jgi:hypothetical protein
MANFWTTYDFSIGGVPGFHVGAGVKCVCEPARKLLTGEAARVWRRIVQGETLAIPASASPSDTSMRRPWRQGRRGQASASPSFRLTSPSAWRTRHPSRCSRANAA